MALLAGAVVREIDPETRFAATVDLTVRATFRDSRGHDRAVCECAAGEELTFRVLRSDQVVALRITK